MSCTLPFQLFPVFLSVETGTHSGLNEKKKKKRWFSLRIVLLRGHWETRCRCDGLNSLSAGPEFKPTLGIALARRCIVGGYSDLPGCTLSKPAVARPQIQFLSSFFHWGFLGCYVFRGLWLSALPCEGVYRGPWSGHQAACKGEGSPPSARGVN